jgi:hypothetical protein
VFDPVPDESRRKPEMAVAPYFAEKSLQVNEFGKRLREKEGIIW